MMEGTLSVAPSKFGTGGRDDNGRRWAWQSIPALQLPPVQTDAAGAGPDSGEEPSKPRPRSLVARVENRILQVKENYGVEKALTTAEEILRARRREAIGRWANFERNFVEENRSQTSGPACCRRRRELNQWEDARNLRHERRAAIVRSRDSRQRSLIAERAMANREMRKHKLTRDRAFAELVYGRIYMRTGGIVRAWSSIIANINRIRFMRRALERAARQHELELNENRLAIATKFMCRMVLRRRRNKAVKVMVGFLSSLTKSNAIGRYAQRVKWGTRHLQAVARRRMACMSSHLILLTRQWDRLYPPATLAPTKTAAPRPSPPSAVLHVSASGEADPKRTPAASPNGSKRPPRRKGGGGGQGGQRKGKGRPRRRQSVVGAGGKEDGGSGGVGQAAAEPALPTAPEGNGDGLEQADRRRPPLFVSSKAKHDEIVAWLQRARSRHCRDTINYERFTIFPCMVELLLQHERSTYHTRLQAIKHVTTLRTFGRLSRVWMENGYFAKMSHVLPPPPRMPRVFTPEEGDEMFDRAAARSAGLEPSTEKAAVNLLREGTTEAGTDTSGAENGAHKSALPETRTIEVEVGAAAVAAAAGEAAVKLVLGEAGVG